MTRPARKVVSPSRKAGGHMVSVAIPLDLLGQIDAEAIASGVSRSDIVRWRLQRGWHMHCPRCQGFVTGRVERIDMKALEFLYCIACGNIWDDQVLRNRNATTREAPQRKTMKHGEAIGR